MKKLVKSIVSAICVLTLLFSSVSHSAAIDSEKCSASFTVSLLDETSDCFSLLVTLSSGCVNCFDFSLLASNSKLTDIEVLFEDFDNDTDSNCVDCFNIETGCMSFASIDNIESSADIAIFTFEKNKCFGVENDNVLFSIKCCYSNFNDTDIEISDSVNQIINITDVHIHNENKIVIDIEPNCNSFGQRTYYCTSCGAKIRSEKIDKSEHKELYCVTVKPSCSDDGYVAYYCKECNTLVNKTIIKTQGHKYITEYKKPDCYHEGFERIVCSECRELFSSVVLPITDHDWTSWAVIDSPDFYSEGLKERTCKNCGDKEQEIIPKLSVEITGIRISMDSLSLNYKQETRLYADVLPQEATYSENIIWTSSNNKIAEVDENGNIKAVKRGNAVVTATTSDGKYSSSCNVTVKYTFLQWIIIYILFGWIWY